MTRSAAVLVALLAALAAAPCFAGSLVPDPPIECEPCAGWAAPHEPFRVFGTTDYVGTAGLSSILITSNDGLVLIDGGLPQSAPAIAENLSTLGFRLEDVRFILLSHAHFDHAGGIAALARASGAQVVAGAPAAAALEKGGLLPDDPQVGFGPESTRFPAVDDVRAVEDGEVVRLGSLEITAHRTPGHTPGGTSWTWRSCEGDRCLDVVYADSLTAVSAPGFRFSGSGSGLDSERGIEATFRASIAKIAELPCDILLAPHPGFVRLDQKLALLRENESGSGPDGAPAENPFVDPGACRAYADHAARGLDRRIAEEQGKGQS